MDKWNLNIEEYSNDELEEILSLNYPYDESDVLKKGAALYEELMKDSSISDNQKENIVNFLNEMTKKLSKIITHGINMSKKDGEISTNFADLKQPLIRVNDSFIIQKKKELEEAYTAQPNDGLNIDDAGGAPPGIINPINIRTIKKAINIDSRFRPNYYTSSSADQQITLPYTFKKVIQMRLASIEIPLTYYAVSQSLGNNVLVIGWNYVGGKYLNEVVVKIPDGNYYSQLYNSGSGSSSIEGAMNAQLQASIAVNTLSPQAHLTNMTIQEDPSFNIRYTVDRASGRSIFALDVSGLSSSEVADITASGYNSFKIHFGVDSNGTQTDNPIIFFLGWELGYRTNIYRSAGSVSGSTVVLPASIVSEGICYIKGPHYMFVAVDDYNNNVNNYYISAYSDSINNKNILARINLASVTQANGFYQAGEDDGFSTQLNRSRRYFGPVDIEKLRITLYDEYGRVLNLNNMDWSCAIMFECLYS